MKVGDLVMRTDDLVRDTLGAGIVINTHRNEDGSPFYQVKWSRNTWDLYWYGKPELEIINEAR